jgi:hypothetical protein
MRKLEIINLSLNNYRLASGFFREEFFTGGRMYYDKE